MWLYDANEVITNGGMIKCGCLGVVYILMWDEDVIWRLGCGGLECVRYGMFIFCGIGIGGIIDSE